MEENYRSLKLQIEKHIKENAGKLEEKLGKNMEKIKSLKDEVSDIRQVAALQTSGVNSAVSDIKKSNNLESGVTK